MSSLARRLLLLAGLSLALLLLLVPPALASGPGDLDPTFNGIGIITNTLFGDVRAVLLQPDHKIVVAGTTKYPQADFALARYHPDGRPDTTFGGGVVTTSIGAGPDGAWSIALYPGNRLIAAGQTGIDIAPYGYRYDLAVARYNPNGSLDGSFGASGVVTTSVTGDDQGGSAVVQPDGRIVVAGSSRIDVGGSRSAWDVAMVRYEANGSLDPTFGLGGIVTTPLHSDYPRHALARQSDGKLVIAGNTTSMDAFALVRYHSDGRPDTGFGLAGVITTPVGSGYVIGYFIGVQPDDKILITGNANGGSHCALARYHPDGRLDTTLRGSGIITAAVGKFSCATAAGLLQANGKLVLVGSTSDIYEERQFLVSRYTPQGNLDTTFGGGGLVTTTISGGIDTALAGLIQPDGKIVAAGITNLIEGLALVRYLGDGREYYLPAVKKE